MLRDITIKNYRAFKDFSMDGLARVNLIVGSNNAGKTSFLEAVYLLTSQRGPSALLQLLDKRGEYAYFSDTPNKVDYQLSHLFNNFQSERGKPKPDQEIHIASTTGAQRSARFIVAARRSSSGLEQPGLQLDAAYDASIDNAQFALDITEDLFFSASTRFTTSRRAPDNLHLIGTELDSFEYLASLSDSIFSQPNEKKGVLGMMRLLDPQIEDIIPQSAQMAGRFIVRRSGSELRLPLSSAGEGLRRIFSLALHAIASSGGVLLVDEIDTGLYYRVQTDVWRLLLRAAKERDIQIFATTHSWDCVEAFQEVLAEDGNADEGYLFRLQRRGDRIYPVGYTSGDLNVAIRHAIEVR